MINAVEQSEVCWKDVKVWINELFSVNGLELTKDNLIRLKQILSSHKQKKYYSFYTNENKEIAIVFPLGNLTIKVCNGNLEVVVDQTTKENIYNLRTNHKEVEQLNSQPSIKVEVDVAAIDEKTLDIMPSVGEMKEDLFNELADFSEESFMKD